MLYRHNDFLLLHKSVLIFMVVFVWVLIYLPGLGVLEFQGTENKRAEPALRMLETGDFTIPSLAGDEYLSKPPLIYWLTALSYYVTGSHSEWSARLPSTLAILSFVLIVMFSGGSFLSIEGRFFISVIFLTSYGIISKGRECEIEALYTALTGISLWFWINYGDELPSSWKIGLLIGVFLGLGLLSKGPLIFLFFYLPVCIYLFKSKRKHELWSIGYVVLILTAVIIFMLWAVQVYHKVPVSSEKEVAGGWYVQMVTRLNIFEFRFGKWARELLAACLNALPWLVLLPFMFFRKSTANLENLSRFRACLIGTLIAFVIVNLMPDVRARYSLPLIANYCILAGWFLSDQAEESLFFKILRKANVVLAIALAPIIIFVITIIHSGIALRILSTFDKDYSKAIVLPGIASVILLISAVSGIALVFHLLSRRLAPRTRHIAMGGILAGVLVIFLFIYVPPFIKPFERKREFGRSVSESVPGNATIYHFCIEDGIGYQPFSYYIKNSLKYIDSDPGAIASPPGSYLLARDNLYEGLIVQKGFTDRQPIIIKMLVFKGNKYYLVKLK